MKPLLILFILCLSIGVGKAQGHNQTANIEANLGEDSLTSERFFVDSIGNQYMVLYTYDGERQSGEFNVDSSKAISHHNHYIALCTIIKYHGNKSQKILTMKAIYSPTECSSDNTKLWLNRLYEYQKKK